MEQLDIEIVRATVEDAAELLALQHLAFRGEAEIYGDWSLPPLLEGLAELRECIRVAVVLKAAVGTQIVGAVRGTEHEGVCTIERLAVLPTFQRRGIGTRLMAAIEGRFPRVRRFELYVGDRSVGNQRLYSRLGYKVMHRERWSPRVTLVFMYKAFSRRTPTQ